MTDNRIHYLVMLRLPVRAADPVKMNVACNAASWDRVTDIREKVTCKECLDALKKDIK